MLGSVKKCFVAARGERVMDVALTFLFCAIWLGACWYMMEQVFIDEKISRRQRGKM